MDLGSVNLENLTDMEQNQLLSLIKKANEPKKKPWKPKMNENFFYIAEGYVGNDKWSNYYNGLYTIGNCFKTKEEAQWMLEHLKVKTELQRFAMDKNTREINWKDKSQPKYIIRCEDDYKLKVYSVNIKDADTVYFSDENIAKHAIDFIGYERLLKYYFEKDK